MVQEPHDRWEEKFIALCQKHLDEEPLYDYNHLYRKGLSPAEAFKAYLQENPDYDEKFEEISGPDESHQSPVKPGISDAEFLERAKLLEAKKKIEEAEQRVSKYCPNCARVMVKKGVCKCGYKRKSGKSSEAY